jgi:hypothetical protein
VLAFISAVWLSAQSQPPGVIHASTQETAKQIVKLKPSDEANSFDFETEQMKGTIRADGAYHGLSSLVDRRTGKQLIHPKLSALNLYRLAAVNQVLGIPRSMERTVQASGNSVEIRWATADTGKDEAAARRQVATVTARYEVLEPNIIEVTVTARATRACAGFEVFMPNYFDKSLVPHIYLQPRGFGRGAVTQPDLVVPTVNDAFRGTLLAFPRDATLPRRPLGSDERSAGQSRASLRPLPGVSRAPG